MKQRIVAEQRRIPTERQSRVRKRQNFRKYLPMKESFQPHLYFPIYCFAVFLHCLMLCIRKTDTEQKR